MILAVTWHIDGVIGSLVREDSRELANRGYDVVVLHPWHDDASVREGGVTYRHVAITIKSNVNIVTSVISALGDFARAMSELFHERYDPSRVRLIISYEWTGSLLGSLAKKFLERPLMTSVHSVESMRTSEKSLLSLSIRGLEMRFLHYSDLVVARSKEAYARVLAEYRVPSDRAKVALSPKDMASIVMEVLESP
ncbi:MAG: glycosyltransferase family 4 protein [Candidatus Verstraetearchaeota archaeon]|nr:glycosyltransferase family 4 protein [Candidatus Verstraetearchaeota archaeon]